MVDCDRLTRLRVIPARLPEPSPSISRTDFSLSTRILFLQHLFHHLRFNLLQSMGRIIYSEDLPRHSRDRDTVGWGLDRFD